MKQGFLLQPCNSSANVNAFVAEWIAANPDKHIVSVDWHCYNALWYVGILWRS